MSVPERARRVRPQIAAVPDAPLPLDRWLSYRFGMVTSRIGRLVATLVRERHGLKLWEWRALAVIARFEPLSAKELSARSSTDPILVARAISALTGKGLASRDADPADRRRAVLRLTDAGRAMHDDVARAAMRIERVLAEPLTSDERAVLARALDKIDHQVAERLQGRRWQDFAG